jgi:AbrB family transcriptional regulator (stage V sporulation protein T)
MNATGIIRRIDVLGRVVIPKEIRKILRIREGDPLEIFVDQEMGVILKKYSPMGNLYEIAKEYTDALNQSTGHIACIADREMIIAVSGAPQNDFLTKSLCRAAEKILDSRKAMIIPKPGEHKFCEGCPINNGLGVCNFKAHVVAPIVSEGDLIGAVILSGKEPETVMGEMEIKIAETTAGFLAKQMEQ